MKAEAITVLSLVAIVDNKDIYVFYDDDSDSLVPLYFGRVENLRCTASGYPHELCSWFVSWAAMSLYCMFTKKILTELLLAKNIAITKQQIKQKEVNKYGFFICYV